MLDLALHEALDQLLVSTTTTASSSFAAARSTSSSNNNDLAVLLFSGFTNPEMLNTYNILGDEIYHESGGHCRVACAKVVPRALQKTLRQVLDEISGDHRDAMLKENATYEN